MNFDKNNRSSSSMMFTFIGNACGIFAGINGTRILTDPWIVDGVFEGSCFSQMDV